MSVLISRFRRWLWVVLALIPILIILAMTIGSFLPEEYAGRAQMRVSRSPEEVWAAVADYEKHPITGRMMKQLQKLPDESGLPVWQEDLGNTRMLVKTVASTPPEHLVLELADQVIPMTARLELRIARLENGSRVTLDNHTVIRRGTWHVPLFRLTMTLQNGAEQASRDYLSRIATSLGEPGSFE